jgi:ATP-dependent Clp protease ATP-binding subunit ClpA
VVGAGVCGKARPAFAARPASSSRINAALGIRRLALAFVTHRTVPLPDSRYILPMSTDAMYLDAYYTTERSLEERSEPMFGRFTDQARRVLALAQEEARKLSHNRTGTEHLLLGLVQEREGIAAEALESLGISLDAVREQVEKITGQVMDGPAASHNQYTLRAKKALDLSLREALQLGHHHIGTEHILLGLLREGEGPAAQVLTELGADLSLVRQQVLRLLDDPQGEPGANTAQAESHPGLANVDQSAERAESRVLAEILSRIEAMDSRLSAVEQQMGAGPDVGDLDQQIAQARRDKEAAAGAEDFENAAALRDRERQLLADKAARQKDWAAAHPDLPSLAEGLHMLSDEVGRLRGLLTQQNNKPRDGAA